MDKASDALEQILNHLCSENIQSVIVEGGSFTLEQFIKNNLWDEARVFVGDVYIGKGLKAPVLNMGPAAIEKIGSNNYLYFRNPV